MTTKDTGAKDNLPSKTMFIKGCEITLNFLPESDDKTIETVKSILLSTYYQDISTESEKTLAG